MVGNGAAPGKGGRRHANTQMKGVAMRINVELEDGLLPDRFGKYARRRDKVDGVPTRSFPIEVKDVPEGAESLALVFIDFDSVPVGGFVWIHWLACNFPAGVDLIPEDESATREVPCVQGRNSSWSPMAGASRNPKVYARYNGPQPPDKTHDYTLIVYALDCMLDLKEGYYLNEFRRAIQGHVLDQASMEIPSRA